MREYIERGALMDKIGERLAYLREKNGDYDHFTDGYEECYCEVEEARAADVVEVRRGTWEKTNMDGFLRCSVCYDCYIEEIWLDGERERWNFCPHCGADLRGEEND